MKFKTQIKISSLVLMLLMVCFVIGVFASNIAFKHIYDKVDKSDVYWNYNSILEHPYKYLVIKGGNVTNIVYEPSPHSSVRLLNYWYGAMRDSVKARVSNDTLYIDFPNKNSNPGEKYWMQSVVLMRLFGPQLLYVRGEDTKFELEQLKQNNISIDLHGRSKLEVETYQHNFDTLNVTAQDSSYVEFEMSPDLKGSSLMTFKQVNADITGNTLLDIGRGQVDSLNLKIADSSGIIISGQAYRGIQKNDHQ